MKTLEDGQFNFEVTLSWDVNAKNTLHSLCEGNVPGHSKRARTCLACRVEVFGTRPT